MTAQTNKKPEHVIEELYPVEFLENICNKSVFKMTVTDAMLQFANKEDAA